MVENRRLFKHVKTGKFYWLLNDHMIIEKTLERGVAYTNVTPYTIDEMESLSKTLDSPVSESIVWIRPYNEFFDGRFKSVKLKET